MTLETKLEEAHNFIETGLINDGINLLKELESEMPNNYNVYYLLGVGYQKFDNFIDAEFYYRKAIEAKPNHHYAYLGLGITFQKQSKFKEAIKCIEQSIKINRYFDDAYNSLGYTFKLKGDRDMAFEVQRFSYFRN